MRTHSNAWMGLTAALVTAGCTTVAVPVDPPVPALTASSQGYELHFDGHDRTASLLARGARDLCTPGPADCYAVEAVRGDATTLRVRGVGPGRNRTAMLAVGAAFEEAYRLRTLTGAQRAEPLLETTMPDGPGTRSAGGDIHDPRADAEPRWSLLQVRAPEAWSHLRAVTGRPAGAEAGGIVIAHPDTGYRQHPEIWLPDPDTSPVWFAAGYDYLRDGPDPLDLLERGNPGHGTVACSVMVSPADCQIRFDRCPTGTAPGARVVPLRMTKSVIVLNQSRLADVIRDAIGADRTRIRTDTDLMAIAAGGPPSWSLWKAVREAENAGYLVVAAAGNKVRTVVWPARFPQVIAVAATNVGCKRWQGSSRGRAVDVSAPGESVWNARTNDEDGASFSAMSSGTTFAVSTAAGVAALWLAAHADDPRLAALRSSGQLTEAFRTVLHDTSWQPGAPGHVPPPGVQCDPDATWDADTQGAGIIDAAALVATPLPAAVAPRTARAATLADLPLWQSLYAGHADRATADYARLFALDDDDTRGDVAIYEAEVLHHYTADPALAETLDAIAQSDAPPEALFDAARDRLRSRDLSPSLRDALP